MLFAISILKQSLTNYAGYFREKILRLAKLRKQHKGRMENLGLGKWQLLTALFKI
jgi:hypothetical protein